ncbi:MAG: Ig-like domain-containing protein [Candidatus Borkfalkia sp.]
MFLILLWKPRSTTKWTEILSKTDYNEGGQEQAPAQILARLGSLGSGDAWTHEFPVRGYGRYVRLRISKIWASADPSNALSLREFALFGRQLEEGQIGGVRFAASSSSEHKDWGDGYGVYALTDNAAAFTGTPRFSFVDSTMPEAPADPDNVDFTLTADLGGAYLVDRFAFYSVNWNQEGKPKQFTVEITADGEQWTQVAEIFGAESGGVVTYTPAYAEGGAGYVQGAAAIDSPDSQQHVVQFPAALAVKVRVHIVKTFPLGENITTAFAEAQVYGTPVFVPAAIAGMPQETVDIALSEQTEYQLSVTVLPASASQEIEYTSADTSIATVDENGLVAFLKAGMVTIRAASKENREIFAETRFSVSEGSVELTGIAFADGTQFEMKQGEAYLCARIHARKRHRQARVVQSGQRGGAEAADILGNEGNQVTAMRVGSAKLRAFARQQGYFADIVVRVGPRCPRAYRRARK